MPSAGVGAASPILKAAPYPFFLLRSRVAGNSSARAICPHAKWAILHPFTLIVVHPNLIRAGGQSHEGDSKVWKEPRILSLADLT